MRLTILKTTMTACVALGATAAVAYGQSTPPPDDRKVCDPQCQADVAVARAVTEKYKNPLVALVSGFAPLGDRCIENEDGLMGQHWGSLKSLDLALAVNDPDQLLYLPTVLPEGVNWRLIGAEWSVPVFVNGIPWFGENPPPKDKINPPPKMFGHIFDGPMKGHNVTQSWHYDLHVWLWEDNPSGMFAQHNPRFACPPRLLPPLPIDLPLPL